MQEYTEITVTNTLLIPLLIKFAKITPIRYYLVYIIHDLIWILVLLTPPILIRLSILNLEYYNSLFEKNVAIFIYGLIGFSGTALLFLIIFASHYYEIPYNNAKKMYIIFRIIFSVIHLAGCLFLLIFISGFDLIFRDILVEKEVDYRVFKNLDDYFVFNVSIISFLSTYSILNVYNTLMLKKALLKIQGDFNDNDKNYKPFKTNKIVPED